MGAGAAAVVSNNNASSTLLPSFPSLVIVSAGQTVLHVKDLMLHNECYLMLGWPEHVAYSSLAPTICSEHMKMSSPHHAQSPSPLARPKCINTCMCALCVMHRGVVVLLTIPLPAETRHVQR
eukprot:scaffold22114_cov21-Tisochrysis_lutea.AAC.3